MVGISFFFWWDSIFGNRNANAIYPTHSLVRIVDRVLEFYTGLADTPAWRQYLYKILQDSPEDFETHAIKSYQDLLSFYAERKSNIHPAYVDEARANLIILLAETRGSDAAQTEVRRLRETIQDKSGVHLLQLAYGQANRRPTNEDIDAVSHYLLPGWTASKLRSRLATNMGDIQLANDIETELISTGKRWGQWVDILLFVHLAVVASGFFLFFKTWRAPSEPSPQLSHNHFTLWTLNEGVGAFVWCLTDFTERTHPISTKGPTRFQ